MPSPIGHALSGVVAGWLVAGRRPHWRNELHETALFAVAGMAADLDLLFGAHSGASHGIGSAAVAAAAGFLLTRQPRTALGVAAAYASHALLDWLGTDSSPPIGIMALWPFTREYYESTLHVFDAISRRYWEPDFWPSNLRAVLREIAILLPLAVVVGWMRKRN